VLLQRMCSDKVNQTLQQLLKQGIRSHLRGVWFCTARACEDVRGNSHYDGLILVDEKDGDYS